MSAPHLGGKDVDDTDTREPQEPSAAQAMPSTANWDHETEPERNNKRRKRDRTASETDLLEAAFRLVERNGVLAGLNLQEVANEAGVNRGLIYRYFGSREGLLRAAISAFTWDKEDIFAETRGMPFSERRARVFELALKNGPFIKLEALLAITNTEEYRLFPRLERSWEDLEQDKREGHLPVDADGLVVHLLTVATYLGYAIFREAMAREADQTVAPGLTPDELDERAIRVFRSMMRAVAELDSDSGA
jgi:AcrR family transcriptional regulator